MVDHTELLRRLAAAEITPEEALAQLRPCFCPEGRRQLWKQGVEAGPDHVLGTPDDIELPAEPEP